MVADFFTENKCRHFSSQVWPLSEQALHPGAYVSHPGKQVLHLGAWLIKLTYNSSSSGIIPS
jgi:hypothetical protein